MIFAAFAGLVSHAAIVRMTMTKSKFVIGDRPIHVHVVQTEGGDALRIECNSPYCDDMSLDPREHPPIVQGREPWRGR